MDEFSIVSTRSPEFSTEYRRIQSLSPAARLAKLKTVLSRAHTALCLFNFSRVELILDRISLDLRDLDNGHYPKAKPINPGTRKKLFNTFRSAGRFTCSYCGMLGSSNFGPDGKPWNIDHREPVSKGGGNHIVNLTICCTTCNRLKATLPEIVYRDILRLLDTPLHIFLSEEHPHKSILESLTEEAWDLEYERYDIQCRMNRA